MPLATEDEPIGMKRSRGNRRGYNNWYRGRPTLRIRRLNLGSDELPCEDSRHAGAQR